MRTPIVTGLTGCSTRSFVSPLRRRLGPKYRSRQILSQSISQSISNHLHALPLLYAGCPWRSSYAPLANPKKSKSGPQTWPMHHLPHQIIAGEVKKHPPYLPPHHQHPPSVQCNPTSRLWGAAPSVAAVLPAAATAAGGPSSQVRSHFGPRAWLVGV